MDSLLPHRCVCWRAVTLWRACRALAPRRRISTCASCAALSRCARVPFGSSSLARLWCGIACCPHRTASSSFAVTPLTVSNTPAPTIPLLINSPANNKQFTIASLPHAQVCKSLRFNGTQVPRGYEERVQRALWVFRHQRVFCPHAKQVVHLRPLPPGGLGAADVDVPSALPARNQQQGGEADGGCGWYHMILISVICMVVLPSMCL